MGIEVTVVVLVALLLVAGAAVKDYAAEVRKSPTAVYPDSSLDPLLPRKDGSSATIQHGHASRHADSGADADHAGCDAGETGASKRAWAEPAEVTDAQNSPTD